MLACGQCDPKRNPTDDFLLDSAGSRFVQNPLCHLKAGILEAAGDKGTSANCDLITEVAEFPLCWGGGAVERCHCLTQVGVTRLRMCELPEASVLTIVFLLHHVMGEGKTGPSLPGP